MQFVSGDVTFSSGSISKLSPAYELLQRRCCRRRPVSEFRVARRLHSSAIHTPQRPLLPSFYVHNGGIANVPTVLAVLRMCRCLCQPGMTSVGAHRSKVHTPACDYPNRTNFSAKRQVRQACVGVTLQHCNTANLTALTNCGVQYHTRGPKLCSHSESVSHYD
jgi:hypothetical protein